MVSSKVVAVVTGSSSGIGHETALTLARNGFVTYATMRNPSKAAEIQSIASKESLPIVVKQLDVTKDVSVRNALQQIVSEAGRIDVVVNIAGYGLTGAFEDLSIEEVKAQSGRNFFVVIRVTQAALPTIRY